jgi:hypothetical protein
MDEKKEALLVGEAKGASAIPTTMKAAFYESYGATASVLKIGQRPTPVPSALTVVLRCTHRCLDCQATRKC